MTLGRSAAGARIAAAALALAGPAAALDQYIGPGVRACPMQGNPDVTLDGGTLLLNTASGAVAQVASVVVTRDSWIDVQGSPGTVTLAGPLSYNWDYCCAITGSADCRLVLPHVGMLRQQSASLQADGPAVAVGELDGVNRLKGAAAGCTLSNVCNTAGNLLEKYGTGVWTIVGDNSAQTWGAALGGGRLVVAPAAKPGSGRVSIGDGTAFALPGGIPLSSVWFGQDYGAGGGTLDLADGALGVTSIGYLQAPNDSTCNLRFDISADGVDRLEEGDTGTGAAMGRLAFRQVGATLTPGTYLFAMATGATQNLLEQHFGFDYLGPYHNHYNIVYTARLGQYDLTVRAVFMQTWPAMTVQVTPGSGDPAKRPPLALPLPGEQGRPVTTAVNTPAGVTLAGMAYDGGAIVAYSHGQPAHGTVTGSGSSVTYTPAPGFSGTDVFTFTVTDSYGSTSAPATIYVGVGIQYSEVNLPPWALSQWGLATPVDTPRSVTLAGVDYGVDTYGSIASYACAQPAHGTLTGTAPNLTYTPAPGYAGPDRFAFTVTDSGGATSSPAWVTLCVGTADTTNASETSTNQPAAAGGHRMKIAFRGYTRGETLTNFPALVVFSNGMGGTDFDFGRHAFMRADGYDLRFEDGTGTNELCYETEQWNTNAACSVWVRVPRLDGSNACIWATWGNPDHTNQMAYTTNGLTWDGTYCAVWHFSSSLRDSTSNGNAGTLVGSIANPDGRVAGAVGFDGSSGYISVPQAASLNLSPSTYTVEAWLYDTAAPGSTPIDHFFVVAPDSYSMRVTDGTQWGLGSYLHQEFHGTYDANIFKAESGAHTIATGVWQRVAFTFDLAQAPGFCQRESVNGVDCSGFSDYPGAGQLQPSSGPIGIGKPYFSADGFKGFLDELRLSKVVRSTNWLWACYMTEASNAAFSLYTELSSTASNQPPAVDNGGAATNQTLASGGTETTLNGYRYHVFTSSGTLAVAATGSVEVLVVGGGGGGGCFAGGGGGGGGLLYSSAFAVSTGVIHVTVGAGGAGGYYAPGVASNGLNGTDSSFATLTARGGGGGAWQDTYGSNGGSGGGGGSFYNTWAGGTGEAGPPRQGYDGGAGSWGAGNTGACTGGGGGGAGGPGCVGTNYSLGGAGGPGREFPQFAAVGGAPAGWFAGGGGGASWGPSSSAGGAGGGGNGGGNGVAGAPNTGGGGGASDGGQLTSGRSGGAGIVIVRYPAAAPASPPAPAVTNLLPGRALSMSFWEGWSDDQLPPGMPAGAVARAHWNNLPIGNPNAGAIPSQFGIGLVDDTGADSGATVSYKDGLNTLDLGYAGYYWCGGSSGVSTQGTDRLMFAYLDDDESDQWKLPVVRVTLPPSFAPAGYDVYVYCSRGSAGNSNRIVYGHSYLSPGNDWQPDVFAAITNITVREQVYTGSGNGGALVEGMGGYAGGNYVVFRGMTSLDFAVAACSVTTPGGRCAINGLQIVAHDHAGTSFAGVLMLR